jgi:hypothetical protein
MTDYAMGPSVIPAPRLVALRQPLSNVLLSSSPVQENHNNNNPVLHSKGIHNLILLLLFLLLVMLRLPCNSTWEMLVYRLLLLRAVVWQQYQIFLSRDARDILEGKHLVWSKLLGHLSMQPSLFLFL